MPQIAARLLGCTAEQLESFAESGVLEPLVDLGPTGQSRSIKYSSEHAIGLLTRLKTMAVRVQDTSGMIGFKEASARLGTSFGETVAQTPDGKVGRLSWTGLRPGLCAIRLREADPPRLIGPAGPRPTAGLPSMRSLA